MQDAGNSSVVRVSGGFWGKDRYYSKSKLRKIRTIQFAGSCISEICEYETPSGEIIKGESIIDTSATSCSY